jgi:putrescine transport system substrate-binding protein
MIARLIAVLFSVCVLVLPARAEDRAMSVHNWTDCIDPAATQRFEKESGIEVHHDEYDSLETLEAKLLTGDSGYDVVVPGDEPSLSRLIKAGTLAVIERSKVPNGKNLDPALMQRVTAADSGNAHGAIYPVAVAT